MKKVKLLILLLVVYNYCSFAQKPAVDAISLHIVVPEKAIEDTVICVTLTNNSNSTIVFENPDRYRTQTFNPGSNWQLLIFKDEARCFLGIILIL